MSLSSEEKLNMASSAIPSIDDIGSLPLISKILSCAASSCCLNSLAISSLRILAANLRTFSRLTGKSRIALRCWASSFLVNIWPKFNSCATENIDGISMVGL